MVVTIKLFGALRAYGTVAIDVPDVCTVGECKQLVANYLSSNFSERFHPSLVHSAALADGHRILADTDKICSAELALLPPVCGG